MFIFVQNFQKTFDLVMKKRDSVKSFPSKFFKDTS